MLCIQFCYSEANIAPSSDRGYGGAYQLQSQYLTDLMKQQPVPQQPRNDIIVQEQSGNYCSSTLPLSTQKRGRGPH